MPQLQFIQQLALLPATVPESILDFLEGISVPDVLLHDSFVASISPECFGAGKEAIVQGIKNIKDSFGGNIISVQVEPYGREVPNAYWCKLVGDVTTRGIGFIMKSKTGNIIKVEFQNSDFNEDELKKRLS